MDKKNFIFMMFSTFLLFPQEISAFGAVLHYQGEVDDREAYFADLRVISNRTDADKLGGATEIKEIDVTAVYENPNKPEFVHMKLQFECQNAFSIDMSTHKLSENTKKIKAGDTVKFRIGPGSYKLRRSDLKSEPLNVSDWKTSNAPMLSKAGAIACNSIEFDQALHAAIKGNDFDFDGFGNRISKLGLPSDMMLIGQTLPPDFLDFAWRQFWWEKLFAGERPDPSGKWHKKVSKAEKEAAIKQLEEMQNKIKPEVEAAKQSLMAGIKKSQTEMAALKSSGKRADGSKLTPIESNLILLWKGRPEKDIVTIMGNPAFNQAGDSRFLRYTKYWEKQGFMAYNAYGNAIGGEVGGYAECFVEFKTKQDDKGEWRVDDILVRSNYEDAGLGRTKGLCQDLAQQASQIESLR
ncbi:hypothetical protein [Sulfuricurvum sp.]|uniref:hypothetical protein n=2 Tax=Sulfuricurvum sp. TaxID=2025608 RepID=UPI00261D309B|nr:hypothetical protein [Sulfuricurvum sp.]MDD4884411.1 hypothetical protein [Sulfuricurvum sp.]